MRDPSFAWWRQARYAALGRLLLLFLGAALVLRLALLLWGGATAVRPAEVARLLPIGVAYDLATAACWLVPFALLTVLPRLRTRPASPVFRAFATTLYTLSATLLAFDLVAEWLFWDEFGVRYNFIAVDYLVYTNEVVGNIRESYPLEWLLPLVGLSGIAAYLWLRPGLRRSFQPDEVPPGPRRGVAAAVLLGTPILGLLLLDAGSLRVPTNTYADELAHNGIYQLFSAFRNNQLDYKTFYRAELEDSTALRHLRPLLAAGGDPFVHPRDLTDITRHVQALQVDDTTWIDPPRRNVIWITVESLSADFLTRYGNTQHITPHLDSLLDSSLTFDDLYATGTRTIRGLEALTLCLPPTPGFSIVKRPHNEGLFSTGALFRQLGYQSRFVYGGYGYFDNMNYFFSHNGFAVTDRADFAPEEIHFANNWGVCDEDLFDKALRLADADARARQPFYYFLMTTSNHRPFTYPGGRIDIPSHTGREGAVKYTDYAIARLLRLARRHPWFRNTLFVVVADHCASSAGKTDVPFDRYHIPGFVYAPGVVVPRYVAGLMSQIDLPPTLLGQLGLPHDTKFFGQDVLRHPPGRAFVGTYQQVGLMRAGRLTILSPRRQVAAFRYDLRQPGQQTSSLPDPADVRDAVAWYQGASWLFTAGRYAGPTTKAGTADERL